MIRMFLEFLRICMKLLWKLKKKMQFDSIEKGEQKWEVFVKRENGESKKWEKIEEKWIYSGPKIWIWNLLNNVA